MKASHVIILVFLVLVGVAFIVATIGIITKLGKDIAGIVDWNDTITSNNGTVISTGTTISIWKDGSGKMHAGFMLEDKQYELQVVE